VGCAAAWGHGTDAASSCYLVEHGETAIALDLGQGSFASLATIRAPESLAAVVISHAHPDHCVDLIPLRHYLRYDAATPAGRVALRGPAGLPGRFDRFVGEEGFLADLPFTALEPGEFHVGGLHVTARRIIHTEDSFAFRIAAADGRRDGLVYSGDCADAGEIVPLLRPGDTLLAEASFGAGPVPPGVPHLDAGRAAGAARDGGAARLVLTHLQREMDAEAALDRAREIFGGQVILARPGLSIDLERG